MAVQSYHPDQAFKDYLALEMQGMFVIELVFLAVGLLLGCAMKQYKLAGSTAVRIILVAYFLSIASGIQKSLDWLKYFTPFKYFDAGELFRSGKLGAPTCCFRRGSSWSAWRRLTGATTAGICIFRGAFDLTLHST